MHKTDMGVVKQCIDCNNIYIRSKITIETTSGKRWKSVAQMEVAALLPIEDQKWELSSASVHLSI